LGELAERAAKGIIRPVLLSAADTMRGLQKFIAAGRRRMENRA
jgi:hypothetical protein